MENRKPNHICRNCGKHYWACDDCDKMHSWRAVACCPECYQKYIEAVLAARSSIQAELLNEPSNGTSDSGFVPIANSTEDHVILSEKAQHKKWK